MSNKAELIIVHGAIRGKARTLPKLVTAHHHIPVVIDAKNKPTNLPSMDEIIKWCRVLLAGKQGTATNIRGAPLDLAKVSNNDAASVWVKFGRDTMDEARMQDYIARYLDDIADPAARAPCVYLAFHRGGFGYIVMEHIHGSTCNDSDAGLVAAAVQSLISIKSPTPEPGYINGGLIQHPFFINWVASRRYESYKQLERHINNILKHRRKKVSFESEVADHGLCLCPADIHTGNFMKDEGNRIVVIDFGGTCFLPPSFAFVLNRGNTRLTQLIAEKVNYPKSTQIDAMMTASVVLVLHGTNEIGVPRELKPMVE